MLIADASKWDHTGFIRVAQLDQIDTLVTDSDFPANARTAIERVGIRLIVADSSATYPGGTGAVPSLFQKLGRHPPEADRPPNDVRLSCGYQPAAPPNS